MYNCCYRDQVTLTTESLFVLLQIKYYFKSVIESITKNSITVFF